MQTWLFLIHITSCLVMTGLIWTIQIVHYPSFHFVQSEKFFEFHQFHSLRISMIVMPLMTIELVTGAYLWWLNGFSWKWSMNSLANLMIWAVTFFLSVPLHGKLSQGMNSEVIDSLIHTNWPRTVLWTIRAVLLLSILMHKLPPLAVDPDLRSQFFSKF